MSEHDWDAFLSHASEDKAAVVLPLAEELVRYGFKPWLDAWELNVGDSLRQKIDRGLAHSKIAIVVLSPRFFAKPWPQAELDALFDVMLNESSKVFPVWHEVGSSDVRKFSPLLAGRLAASTRDGIPALAAKIAARLGAKGRPLDFVIDLASYQVTVSPERRLEDAIRESGDVPGSYTNRRVSVRFVNGPRQEEKEIERGIRLILFHEPLTLFVRNSLSTTIQSFVQKYDYNGLERGRTKIDLWLRENPRTATGVWLTDEEVGAYVPSLVFARGPFRNDVVDLPAQVHATRIIPQLLFRYFREERNQHSEVAPYLHKLLTVTEYTWGPG